MHPYIQSLDVSSTCIDRILSQFRVLQHVKQILINTETSFGDVESFGAQASQQKIRLNATML